MDERKMLRAKEQARRRFEKAHRGANYSAKRFELFVQEANRLVLAGWSIADAMAFVDELGIEFGQQMQLSLEGKP